MNDSAQQLPGSRDSGRQALAEIVLIFAVFALQGAWPLPDVNEPYYLGKAIHFWNPEWLHGDFFMESRDTHKVFYFAFGWLSLWLSPAALAWTGRILSWGLLALAWRRLSFAVVPRAWWSVLTAALFGCLMERCQMAGEWVIGGVEAKSFAYVFVILAIEAIVRSRWNLALILLGAATAFHALVGGWAAVAVGIAWVVSVLGKNQGSGSRNLKIPKSHISKSQIRSLWPGLLGGLVLALLGIIPAVALDWGVDRATARQAHEIYVFERLPHHLTLSGMRPDFVLRLALLWTFWLVLGRWSRRATWGDEQRRPLRLLRAVVSGAVTITFAGAVVNLLALVDRGLAADLLRYYWFRLTDVMLPLGVAIEAVALIVEKCRVHARTLAANKDAATRVCKHAPYEPDVDRRLRRLLAPDYLCLILVIVVAGLNVGEDLLERLHPTAPRSHRGGNFDDWRTACQWVAESETPADACFLVPREAATFAWFAGRGEVVDWKDVPQDAKSLVEWWNRIQDVYITGFPEGPRWYEPLAGAGTERVRQLGKKYGAGYIITERVNALLEPPLAVPLNLPLVYKNKTYAIYRIE